jgi:hypothetical protein
MTIGCIKDMVQPIVICVKPLIQVRLSLRTVHKALLFERGPQEASSEESFQMFYSA